MKTRSIVLFLLVTLKFNPLAIGQNVDWLILAQDTSSNLSALIGIGLDDNANAYLTGTLIPGKMLNFSGQSNFNAQRSYITKVDSDGNFIKSRDSLVGYYDAFYGNIRLSPDKWLYALKQGYEDVVNVFDTSFNFIKTLHAFYAGYGNGIYNFYLAPNKTVYINGYWTYMSTPMHYSDGSAVTKIFDSGAFNYECYSNAPPDIQCYSNYNGDSLGRYVYGNHVRNANGSFILDFANTNPRNILRTNFNSDNSFSVIGLIPSGGNTYCGLTSPLLNTSLYYLSRLDSTGQCIWAKDISSLNNYINDAKYEFDREGNLYFYFFASDTVVIDSTVIIPSHTYSYYIGKININGNLEYCHRIAYSDGTRLTNRAMSVDNAGNFYFACTAISIIDSLPGLYMSNYGLIPVDTIGINKQTFIYSKINYPVSTVASICPGDSVFFAGDYYTSPGLYYDSLSVNFPNDSVVILDLSYAPTVLTTLTQQLCIGDSIFFNGRYIYNTGTYKDTLTATTGCDSIVTLNVSLYNYTTTVQQLNDTLYANATAGPITNAYQWLNCDSSIVYNFNQPYFIPPHTGNYAAIAQNGSCADTSACISYVTTSINNFSNSGKFSIYPNPTYTSISINFENGTVPLNSKAVLYDIHHKKVMEVAVNKNGQTVNLNMLNQGMYVLTLISDKELFRSMVVKLP